ncbi:MAG TPA: glycosyltransferase, partial [Anaerovoracaceae bacterium]|nr:glycosyltransferase [Anaerovoracaceae bacterium]
CSTEVSFEEICETVKAYITEMPYHIFRNEENLGSTKTFEKLTLLAAGEYIAYCDQDDIWHRDKLEICLKTLIETSGVLAFSDMIIIDGKGKKTADSITKVRKHHKFYSGAGLAEILLFSNFVTGCTILIKADKAKDAVPFCPHMVHDHWLALYCAVNEKLEFINQRLIDYRIHNNSQTLMMAGVVDKKSYLEIRIEASLKKFLWLQGRLAEEADLNNVISRAVEWMTARKEHFHGSLRSSLTVWKYRRFSYLTSLFELLAPYVPDKVFMFIIGLKKKNII